MSNFEFSITTRIVFGPGTFMHAGSLLRGIGCRAFVLTGSSARFVQHLFDMLRGIDIEPRHFRVEREPTIEIINDGLEIARRFQCDFVIGLGGGSVIDTAKAIAAMLSNDGDLSDYLEVIGKGKQLSQPSVPCIAIPTTSGTGAEVTKNAVIDVPEHKIKVSLRSPLLAPRLAIIDPELTYTMPSNITAYTGMDALTQLIEPYTSKMSNPLVDPLCREGIRRIACSIRRAFNQPDDFNARENMSFASLIGGIALANAKLGAVHGFAGPIGGMFRAPHGAICARLLPFVMETNFDALESRGNNRKCLEKYEDIAWILTQGASKNAKEGVSWVKRLIDDLAIPPLSEYGVKESDFQILIERAAKSSSMRGNPIDLTPMEMRGILSKATYLH